MLELLKKELQENSSEKKAKTYRKFFKTNKGEYGEKDIFIGVSVPKQREIAKKYSNLSLAKIQELLKNDIHEYRMIALILLVNKYEKTSEENKANLFHFYLKNIKKVNNWDLVDISCPKIVGEFLYKNKKHRRILYELSKSENLWERRIGIVSTLYFIRKEEFEDALAVSEILLKDSHDLIHKAVGWILREVGKKNKYLLENFLKQHYKEIPRTSLRYAIERLNEKERQKYLKGLI